MGTVKETEAVGPAGLRFRVVLHRRGMSPQDQSCTGPRVQRW